MPGVVLHDHAYCLRHAQKTIDHCYARQYAFSSAAQQTCKTEPSFLDDHTYSKHHREISDTAPNIFDLTQYNGSYTIVHIGDTTKRSLHVPADGDCFFHSLSIIFNGQTSNSRLYRRMICGYILDNWNAWEDSVHLCHDRATSPNTYMNNMVLRHGYATAAEIQAACSIFAININVWLRGIAHNSVTGRFEHRYNLQPYQADNATVTIELMLSDQHFTVLTCEPHHTNMVCSKSNKRRLNTDKPETTKRKKNAQLTSEIFDNHGQPTKPTTDTYNNDKKNSTVSKEETHTQSFPMETCKVQTFLVPSAEEDTYQKCRKLGIPFKHPFQNEQHKDTCSRKKLNKTKIKQAQIRYKCNVDDLPSPPPLSDDPQFNTAMDCIRSFELQQMSYQFKHCSKCHECRLEMKMSSESVCYRCNLDKGSVKMFSNENNMNPQTLPEELMDMTVVEQQLISRIAPFINVHLLKHGGIAANGHCVTFPQNVNEPAQILPMLPKDVKVIRVRKKGSNDTLKDFNVRRSKVEHALIWLKNNNPAYSNIEISQSRLQNLPENAPLHIDTIETDNDSKFEDKGPAGDQFDPGDIPGGITNSCTGLDENEVNINEQVNRVVEEIVGQENAGNVPCSNKYPCIPWPTQGNEPLSEFTTKYFFTMAFPCLFPYGLADFHINRPRTCTSMAEWAEHLIWFKDGRFAQHAYFKFIVHNMIMRKRTIEQSAFVVKQQLGEQLLTLSDLKKLLQDGDKTVTQKILYFGACLRGTQQYWAQRQKELRSLIQYKINEGKGLPSFFTTGSCAEYYFQPLKRLIKLYTFETSGKEIDLENRSNLFTALQKNTHIVSMYFDLRTMAYFNTVMANVFGVDTFWYRQEFAKSRGMIHWHGLCWRNDREPHNLLHEAIKRGLSEDQCASKLSEWAKANFAMTAMHPAGTNENGTPNLDLWPPPEGTAEAPPEEKNPLIKLLMDVSETQQSLLEDHILLSNRINIHRCSTYCLKQRHGKKICRMEFGTEKEPGKILRNQPAIVKDKNGSFRLEMQRDHPMMVQHSRYHTQGWRANGDISLILSKSPPDNPSVTEIIATEKYITGYACKGNEQTGAVSDLFQDIVKASDDASGATTKSVCTKLLMNTIKRDVASMEASYELLSLPLYRCSHQFQSLSFSGSRVLEQKGQTLTKSTPLDKYLARPNNQTCSWYQFVCNSGKIPVPNGTSVRATWPLTEEYCRSMVLLHWPNWRHLSEIKNEKCTWIDIFLDFIQTEDCPNFVKADVERAKNHISSDLVMEEEEDSDNQISNQPAWMDLLQPQPMFHEAENKFHDGGPDFDWGQSSRQYPDGYGLNWLKQMNPDTQCKSSIDSESLSMLNKDQQFAFSIIMSTLMQYKTDPKSVKPLRLIVAGTAGSGKSFLIKCLVHAISNLFQNNNAVQVLCPTGNAAHLISGRTIHDFFKVPTQRRALKELKTPDGVKGEVIQQNCQNLNALLIDERSLVGSTTLGWTEFLCKFGKGNMNNSWGGLPVVVFFGDDVQLPPVMDTPVYSTSKCASPASMHGTLVWQEFDQVVELSTIIRQSSDEQDLRRILLSLRDYHLTVPDTKWLQQFQWDNLKEIHGNNFLHDLYKYGLFVFPTHAAECNHNTKELLKANATAPVATLKAVNKGTHAMNAKSDQAQGLEIILHLCISAKVMLTSNLHVPYGLFNGSMGVVKDIIYLNGRSPPMSLPDVVMVSFPKYTGPSFVADDPTLVPIVPVERQIDCFCHGCKRTQIPLRLAWGTTIHKCQGMSIGEGEINRYIIIDPGTNKFESQNPGALFVALSRAKSAGGCGKYPDFAWNENVLINEDRICHRVDTPTTRARSTEILRLQTLAGKTRQYFQHLDSKHTYAQILRILFQRHILSTEE